MFAALGWEAWVTCGTLVLIVIVLLRNVARPDLVFLTGLAVLLGFGILTLEQAFSGLSNSAVLTVASLFVVSAGVQRTGALRFLRRLLFSETEHEGWRLLRLMAPTALFSAFLNNTPIVAMLMPEVQRWAEHKKIPASRLLIPLSYAAIVGGMITLIGTSTNILVSGILEEQGHEGLGLFDFAKIGIPATGALLGYFFFVGYRFLPNRGRTPDQAENGLTSCLFELRVEEEAPFIGQTVEEAQLRSLGSAYLAHLRRNSRVMRVSPDQVLEQGDVLTFVGSIDMLEQLLLRPGLGRVMQAGKMAHNQSLPLFEAVVSASSKLVGKTLRASNFREAFGGVVLAIRRHDGAITESLGRTVIQSGDLLIIEAKEGFEKRWNARRDEFYLVALYRAQALPQPEENAKDIIAAALLLAMIIAMATGWMPPATAAFLVAMGMIITRCLTVEHARQALNMQVLVLIVAALGLGEAIQVTGLAHAMSSAIIYIAASFGISAVLIALYFSTNILTELITNNAAAVLMMPIALDVASELGVAASTCAIVVAIAASASFITPIGYQTNLMVLAAGHYRFTDYARVGFGVSILIALIVIAFALQ